MKFPKEFIATALDSVKQTMIESYERKNFDSDIDFVCNSVIAVSYSLLLHYHEALRIELLEKGIDIGHIEQE